MLFNHIAGSIAGSEAPGAAIRAFAFRLRRFCHGYRPLSQVVRFDHKAEAQTSVLAAPGAAWTVQGDYVVTLQALVSSALRLASNSRTLPQLSRAHS